MVGREELVSYLDTYLNSPEFSDYCPNGLQVQGREKIKKIALAVSATRESIDRAVEWGADALLVHHGVFWKYQGAKPLVNEHFRRVEPLIKNEVNLIAYHLPLDAHLEVGNAAGLAEKIDLTNLDSFGDYKRMPLGVKGVFSKPIKVTELEKHLEKVLQSRVRVASPDNSQEIETLGIITGGANNEWVEAKKAGLDAYLTGEISEYNWHDAIEAGIHFFAGGHHATEKFGVQSLSKKLSENFSLEFKFFDSDNLA